MISVQRIDTAHDYYQKERELRNSVLLRPYGIPDHAWEMHDTKAWHFVAIENEKVIGCVLLLLKEDGRAQLLQMATDHNQQGKGIGKLLLDELLSFASTQNIEEVFCHARENAIGFYSRAGFEIYDEPFTEVGIFHRYMKIAVPSLQPKFQVFKSGDFSTNRWSGGTTTELYIYPPDAEYAKRNFDFRLSLATIETEESVFTPLPGVSRNLFLREGEMLLEHEGHHSIHLKKFDADRFEGDWTTLSKGKCSPFNLMTRGTARGKVSSIVLNNNSATLPLTISLIEHLAIYIHSGIATVETGDYSTSLNTGDMIIIQHLLNTKINIQSIENCELIVAEINN